MFRFLALFSPKAVNTINITPYRPFMTDSNVLSSSPNISTLYRAQDLENFFNPLTFILGVFATKQPHVLTKDDVVGHQKSTTLVGTTTSFPVAQHLAKDKDNAGILFIDPRGFGKFLIDTENTVKKAGTSFYPKLDEHEQSLTVLPIIAIRKIEGKNGKIINNPFYIPVNPENAAAFKKFEQLYRSHMNLLEDLYESEETVNCSGEVRQALINQLVILYNDFYQDQLGDRNPFNMTISQFNKKYSDIFPGVFSLDGFNGNSKIIDVILASGDELFKKNPLYRSLVAGKKLHDMLESEENPYPAGNRVSFD